MSTKIFAMSIVSILSLVGCASDVDSISEAPDPTSMDGQAPTDDGDDADGDGDGDNGDDNGGGDNGGGDNGGGDGNPNQDAHFNQTHEGFEVDGEHIGIEMTWRPSGDPLPAVVFIGGAPEELQGEAGGFLPADYFSEQGYAHVRINRTRLSAKGAEVYPDDLQLTACQISWVRDNAETFNIDPDQLYFMGFSLSGHLASVLAFSSDVDWSRDDDLFGDACDLSTTPAQAAGVMLFAAPVDLDTHCAEGTTCLYGDLTTAEQWASVNTMAYVDNAELDPPTLLIYGEEDGMINPIVGESFHTELLDKGISSTFSIEPVAHEVPWFQDTEALPEADADLVTEVQSLMLNFLKENTPAQDGSQGDTPAE